MNFHVRFAHHGGAITGLPELTHEAGCARRKTVQVEETTRVHSVSSAGQGGPAGTTEGSVAERPMEADARGGQPFEIRGVSDSVAMGSEKIPAMLIGDEEQNIRLRRLHPGRVPKRRMFAKQDPRPARSRGVVTFGTRSGAEKIAEFQQLAQRPSSKKGDPSG